MNRHKYLFIYCFVMVFSCRAAERVVFEYDGLIDKYNKGFVWEMPPNEKANGNWTKPHNFADGTFHIYTHVRSMPSKEPLYVWFNMYQKNEKPDARENEIWTERIKVEPGRIRKWSRPISASTYKPDLDGTAVGKWIDFNEPRSRNCLRFCSDKGYNFIRADYVYNWPGGDVNDYFPMDIHFIVAVTEKKNEFSGWENYVSGKDLDGKEPAVDDVKAVDQNKLCVTFNEWVGDNALLISNYRLDPHAKVKKARFGFDRSQVVLTTSDLNLNTTYTLTLSNIQDRAQHSNVIKGTQVTFTTEPVSAFDVFQAERFDDQSGVKRLGTGTSQWVNNYKGGEYIRYSHINFGDGVKMFEVHTANDFEGAIELRIDSPDGQKIAQALIPRSMHWYKRHTTRIPVNNVTGVHDLYICMTKNFGWGGIDAFTFIAND